MTTANYYKYHIPLTTFHYMVDTVPYLWHYTRVINVLLNIWFPCLQLFWCYWILQYAFSELCYFLLFPDFAPSLKRLFSNKVYLLIILTSVVAFNGFIGMITFKPKFMEQVYGQSPSKAIFLIGRLQYKRHTHRHFLSPSLRRKPKPCCHWKNMWLR